MTPISQMKKLRAREMKLTVPKATHSEEWESHFLLRPRAVACVSWLQGERLS